MRRKPGAIIPLERDILEAADSLRSMGVAEPHGFLLARTIGDQTGSKHLAAYGTLYKALDRLERAGLLTSRWEDPDFAAAESRPRRRLYRVTEPGNAALAEIRRAAAESEGTRVAERPAVRPAKAEAR
ncbi:MAG TPA: PadR family transcriptional regulator [Candidatus Saccharimonadales bacterium]|nr:PadR family transcriptional regulator [Candidatus Saccharimonadales bacterium]